MILQGFFVFGNIQEEFFPETTIFSDDSTTFYRKNSLFQHELVHISAKKPSFQVNINDCRKSQV